MRKRRGGTASGEINVERGAEGVLAREKRGTTKTGGDTGSYTMRWLLSRCQNLSGTETILSYVKLTFKSTRGD